MQGQGWGQHKWTKFKKHTESKKHLWCRSDPWLCGPEAEVFIGDSTKVMRPWAHSCNCVLGFSSEKWGITNDSFKQEDKHKLHVSSTSFLDTQSKINCHKFSLSRRTVFQIEVPLLTKGALPNKSTSPKRCPKQTQMLCSAEARHKRPSIIWLHSY